MAIPAGALFGHTCGASDYRIAATYNPTYNRIDFVVCIGDIDLANSWTPVSNYSNYKFVTIETGRMYAGMTEALAISTIPYGITQSTNRLAGANLTISTSGFLSLNDYLSRIHYHPEITWGFYYYESAQLTADYLVNYVNGANSLTKFLTFEKDIPYIPIIPTFNVVNYCEVGELFTRITRTSANDAEYYSIQRATSSGGIFTEVGQISGTTTFFDDTTCVPNTTYFYKIVAHSTPWDIPSVEHSILFTYGAPTSIAWTPLYDSCCTVAATLTSDLNACGATNQRWYGKKTTDASYVLLQDLPVASGNSLVVTGLDPITNYSYYSVFTDALNNEDQASAAVVVNITPALVDAPVLSATLGGTTIDLTWTDTNQCQSQYELWRKVVNNYPTTGLQSLWKLNETTGTIAYDSVGTINGGLGVVATSVPGKLGYARNFASASARIDFGTTYRYERTQAFSYSVWIKTDGAHVTNQSIVSCMNSTNSRGYEISTNASKIIFRLSNTTGTNYISKTTTANFFTDNQWHLLNCTYDGTSTVTGMKIYVDGVLITSTTNAGTLTATIVQGGNIVSIGNDLNITKRFYGTLDEVAIWNKALSQAEVTALYNNNHGLDYSPTYVLYQTTADKFYSDANLTVGSEYYYKVRGKSICTFGTTYSPYSNEVITDVTTILLAPTYLNFTNVTCSTSTLNWTNNNITGQTGNYIQELQAGVWTTVATVAADATSYNFDTQVPLSIHSYRIIAYNVNRQAISSTVAVQYLDPTPINLSADAHIYHSNLSWTRGCTYGTSIHIEYRICGSGNWTWTQGIAASISIYTLQGLLANTCYEYRVVLVGVNGSYPSAVSYFTTTTITFDSFCNGTNYEATEESLCGVSVGEMTIANLDYFEAYTFLLEDTFGNQYTFNETTGKATGLPAGWYTLTATPKPAVYYLFGTEPCVIPWLAIIDNDTSMTLTSTIKKKAQCQPFDSESGRIFYSVSGINTGNTYNFFVYNSDGELLKEVLGTNDLKDFIITKIGEGCYYGLIIDVTTGCHLLLPVTCIESESPFSNGGLKKVWIAKWSTDLDYNYWKTSDEDYFLEFEDSSFFNSTKIKKYFSASGGTIQWYELPIADKYVKLSQKLNKVRQGFIFEDLIDIAITKVDADKWVKIGNILNPDNKWVVVVIDDNDFAWTSGFSNGCRINTFKNQSGLRGEDNGYSMQFSTQSSNKILTALDRDYIKNFIV